MRYRDNIDDFLKLNFVTKENQSDEENSIYEVYSVTLSPVLELQIIINHFTEEEDIIEFVLIGIDYKTKLDILNYKELIHIVNSLGNMCKFPYRNPYF